MRSSKGFALIEILIVAVIMMALAYLALKQRKQQVVTFQKTMKDAGVKVPANVKSVDDLQKAVELQLKATGDQHQKALDKAVDGGN